MQDQLDIATKWCHDNGLIINASKTKIMHVKPRHLVESTIEIKFHNVKCLHQKAKTNNHLETCTTNIELVTSYKYLGVYVDSDFKWKTQVENVRKKLRKSAYILNHLSNCATYSVLRQAYFSLAESYIRHGIAAWGSATYCRTLQKSQNNILKLLWKNNRTSTSTRITTNNTTNNITNANNRHNNQILTYTNLRSNTHNNTTNYYNTLLSTSNALFNPTNNIDVNDHNSWINNTSVVYQANNQQTTTCNLSTININNIAKELNILNVKSIYYTTLANDFFNSSDFLHEVDHAYNTRRRAQKRYKVQRFLNEYGRNTLSVTLPTILNKLPTNIINTKNEFKRKKLIKNFFISSQ